MKTKTADIQPSCLRRRVRDFSPQSAKCPDCDSYHGPGSMVPHLQWQHSHDPEAAKYRTSQIFRHELDEWRKAELGIPNT